MKFERVRKEVFAAEVALLKKWGLHIDADKAYDNIVIPRRSTDYSAGYDICTPIDIIIPAGQKRVIPTGIKAVFRPDELRTWFLAMYVRSSVGIRDSVVLCNGTGIIDADYQYSNTDGDMKLALRNVGDLPVKYKAGDRICQGVFTIYGVTEDDEPLGGRRSGGVGSTGR